MLERFLKERIRAFNPYHAEKGMTYEDGLLLLVALRYHRITGDRECLDFLKTYLETHITADGEIVNYHADEYNIDNILAGRVLADMADQTGDPRYDRAAAALRRQLETHPRTASGNFWHKLRYPYQIWLDGLYMSQPFRLAFAYRNHEKDVPADVMHQIENVRKLLWDEDRKMYVHAYDEKKAMQWADPLTGRSPNIWLRAVGWFAMALADLADICRGRDAAAQKRLGFLLRELLDGMTAHRDPASGMWHQVVDRPDASGNYLETSGSAMLAYAALKGVRIGVLPARPYRTDALRTIAGIESANLRETPEGLVLGGICAVAGLDNERRDGTVAYYLSERIGPNDVKGVAPYCFCKIEQIAAK